MSEYGFFITRLVVQGPRVPDAVVELADGLNVISGPSNTGKTFICQCIDFALGRKDPPEDIVESKEYESVCITLVARKTNDSYELSRSLSGGEILRTGSNGERVKLKAKHTPKSDDSVSAFLLGLCGLAGKWVVKNQRGTTRSVSFRDIARLTIIDEESIITRRSPIHSGRPTDETVEQSVVRLLLTGNDDSSVVEASEAKLVRAKAKGREELFHRLEKDVREKLSRFQSDETLAEITARRERIDTAVASLSKSVDEFRANLKSAEDERHRIWTATQKADSRQEVLSQLHGRFTLLHEQYGSDIQRLKSTAEVGARLGDLKEERCPLCGALAEHHEADHEKRGASPDAITKACLAEIEKISVLLKDLEETDRGVQAESKELASERRELEAQLAETNELLEQKLRPKLTEILNEHKQLYEERSRLDELLLFHESLDRLELARRELDTDSSTRSESISTKLSVSNTDELCKELEQLFDEWRLPEAERVSFSEDAQDIVISGRPRSSDGKGVRAITHAGFTIGLTNYCVKRSLPNSSFIVLDSPLVVYREPDEDERDFSQDVKSNFFRAIRDNGSGRQIIILENDEPPADIDESCNVIHFTKSSHGRYGFFPVASS